VGEEDEMPQSLPAPGLLLNTVFMYTSAHAQEMTEEEAAAACAVCSGGIIILAMAIFAIDVLMLV
jgi:xanthine/uracil/vitamin C permease (AzgA family)